MSDDWIIIVPTDPRFVPEPGRQLEARAWLASIAPEAEQIEIKESDQIEFFDCGSNFDRAVCPSCHAEIPMVWWEGRMADDHNGGFKLDKYQTSCCGAAHTLDELIYDWPRAFGRFALDVMNPNIGKLNELQQNLLEQILGTRVRIIYQHI